MAIHFMGVNMCYRHILYGVIKGKSHIWFGKPWFLTADKILDYWTNTKFYILPGDPVPGNAASPGFRRCNADPDRVYFGTYAFGNCISWIPYRTVRKSYGCSNKSHTWPRDSQGKRHTSTRSSSGSQKKICWRFILILSIQRRLSRNFRQSFEIYPPSLYKSFGYFVHFPKLSSLPVLTVVGHVWIVPSAYGLFV